MHRLAEILSQPKPDIAQVALALATDFDPRIDVGAVLRVLEDLAAPLKRPRISDPAEQARAMARVLHHGGLGLRGDVEDYNDPRHSYLHSVLQRKRGIPISLSAVWMAVGQRADIPVEGIGFPGHFLIRVGEGKGVYVDAFREGAILDAKGLQELAHRFAGTDVCDEYLMTVDARSIAVRMLVNLKHAFERLHDHANALVACDRLVDLTGKPEAHRDRGLHAFALGSYSTAVHDLTTYLAHTPQASDADHITGIVERAKSQSRQSCA